MSRDICAARWASCSIQNGEPHYCNRDPGHIGAHRCGCGVHHMDDQQPSAPPPPHARRAQSQNSHVAHIIAQEFAARRKEKADAKRKRKASLWSHGGVQGGTTNG